MRVLRLPGVFRPRSDSWMLARAAHHEASRHGCEALDLCTGSGAVAVACARAGASATAVDVSRRALLCARINARLNGVRVRALRGDLLDAVGDQAFDLITANPPYLPSDRADLPARGPERAWEGGRDGRTLIDRIAVSAATHLRPGGVLLLVQSSVCGEARTLAALTESGLRSAVVERERGPLGPLLRGRAERLEAEGLLAPGCREEELQLIRAWRPRRRASASPRPAAEREPAATSR